MRPKFEVGEIVILQSKSRPECCGEFTVLQINVTESAGRFEFEGNFYRHDSAAISYFLDDPYPSRVMKLWKACWDESSLRKKHIPGELNFRELMSSLSSPKLLTHSPR